MAVCGRCLICGHKFSCGGEDEAIRWTCESALDPCAHYRKYREKTQDEAYEHAICKWCHDALVLGDFVEEIEKFLEFVRTRSEQLKSEEGIHD